MPSMDSIQITEHVVLLLFHFCKSLQLNLSSETQFVHVPFLHLAQHPFLYSFHHLTLWLRKCMLRYDKVYKYVECIQCVENVKYLCSTVFLSTNSWIVLRVMLNLRQQTNRRTLLR